MSPGTLLPLLAALLPGLALAQPTQEAGGLVLGGSFATKLQTEFSAPQGSKPRVSVFTDAELQLYANWQDWFSLNAVSKLERTRNTNLGSYYPDRNNVLRSEVGTLRQLYATVRPVTGLSLYAGKIHPNFGAAWGEAMPGTFANFASDYEQDERLGAGVSYRLPPLGIAALDPLTLTVETFMLDTSLLSYSLPRGPSLFDAGADRAWRNTRARFGPANTGTLASYTVSVQGGRPGTGLAWQASLTREATADPAAAAQSGQSVSASYDPTGSGIALTPHLGVTPFVEYTHLANAGTVAGLTRHYLLAGLAFRQGDWTLAFAAGLRRSQGALRDSDQQQNVTLTRDIGHGFNLGLGLNHARIAGRASWTVAPALSWETKF